MLNHDKILNIFLLSLYFSSILNAHSGFMSSWGLADFIVFFSVPLLVFFLILRTLLKTNIFIYTILFFFIPSLIITSIITPFIDKHTSSSWHRFQKYYEYDTYQLGGRLYKDIEIIGIDKIDSKTFIFLDSNNTLYTLNNFMGIASKTYIKELDRVDSVMYGYSKLLFLQDKKIIVYKRGVKDNYYTNNWSFSLYDTKRAINKFLYKGYHLLYKKNNSIEINNLQAIKDISYDIETAILLIDKSNKALCVYDGEKILHKIILKDIPKLAIYNNEKDKIYVVYENKKGLDILSKKENKIYVRLQNIAKEKISKAVLPFWKYRFSEHSKEIDILREYLTGSIHADFDYKVDEYSDKHEVLVTSRDRENININIKFTFAKKDKIALDKISYPKKQKKDVNFLEEMGYIEKEKIKEKASLEELATKAVYDEIKLN